MKFRVLSLVLCLSVFVVLAEPAAAFGFFDFFHHDDEKPGFSELESQVLALNERPRLMKFINSNMYGQGVAVVEIAVRSGSGENLAVYSIVRNETGRYSPAVILKSEADVVVGGVWKFYPTVSQARRGLKLFEAEHLSPEVVLQAVWLYLTVDGENVPGLRELVENSGWLDRFLDLGWMF